jgi:hypothetical protein
MTVRSAVTVTFDSRPPLTHRSTFLASRVAQAAFAGDATRAEGLRPLNWTWPVQTLLQTRPRR